MKEKVQEYSRLIYVLISPAHNEEDYIEKTIQSVMSQTILPSKWVIVSDGSTDRTDEIIKGYILEYPWIAYTRMPEHKSRQFAAKAQCFRAGYEKVRDMEFDIIGNLDADISLEDDYFEYLIEKFVKMPELGVAGTPFIEVSSEGYNYDYTNIEHVSGACQLFRRECFEEIGGYVPIEGGGIDWTAVTTARMKGWKTRTFTEKACVHHRAIGTAGNALLMSWFNHGYKDYYLGGHPLWEMFRAIYQMAKRPYFLGGLFLLAGYLWAFFRQIDKPVSVELQKFHRQEQMNRLKAFVMRLF